MRSEVWSDDGKTELSSCQTRLPASHICSFFVVSLFIRSNSTRRLCPLRAAASRAPSAPSGARSRAGSARTGRGRPRPYRRPRRTTSTPSSAPDRAPRSRWARPARKRGKTRARNTYEKKLRQQYFEHGNRLSWDAQSDLRLTLNGAKTFDDNGLPPGLSQAGGRTLSRTGSALSARSGSGAACGQTKCSHITFSSS